MQFGSDGGWETKCHQESLKKSKKRNPKSTPEVESIGSDIWFTRIKFLDENKTYLSRAQKEFCSHAGMVIRGLKPNGRLTKKQYVYITQLCSMVADKRRGFNKWVVD